MQRDDDQRLEAAKARPRRVDLLPGASRRRVLAARFAAGLIATGLAGAVFAQAVTLTPPNLAGPALVGGIKGNEGALPTGDAAYVIPVQLPPGTAGIVPTLQLAYASRAEEGLLGRGWAIGGLSQITRCGKTLAQDGLHRGVDLTAVDQFCLDGQRLMLRSGTHGAVAEYRTELDQFNQVTSTGTNPAAGPTSFTVRSRDGLIHTYGGTDDSRIEAQGKTAIHTWALSRVQDRRGNYYDIDYEENNATGEFYPARVRYTGNLRTATPTYNAVRFVYETRPDPWNGHVMGSLMQRTRRLTAIRTVKNTDGAGAGGDLVREVRIAYAVSPTSGRSLVVGVSDCDAQGSCLPATTFSWTTRDPAANTSYAAGSGIWGGPAITIESTAKQPIPSEQVKAKTLMGDFNGDGATDLLYADGGSAWKVCLAAKTTFNCQSWPAVAGRSEEALVGDFNGDGRSDIALLPTEFNVKGNYTVCLSTGSGFACQAWSAQTAGKSAQRYLVADMDVDGRDDLLVLDFYGGYLCRSNGTGFDPCMAQANLGAALQMGDDPELRTRIVQRLGDLNGDGRPDIIKYNMRTGTPASGHWQAYVAVDGGFAAWPAAASAGIALGPLQPGQSLVADYNADPFGAYGDTAAVVGTSDPLQPKMEICRSTGVSLVCTTRPYASATQMPFEALADQDRDGRIDGFGYGYLCQLSDTAVTPCATLTGPPFQGAFQMATLVGDFNGDGLLDRALYEPAANGNPARWDVRLTGAGRYVDLLERVDEGGGRSVRFTYAGLDDPTVHEAGPLVAYPARRVTAGQAVLSRLETSNGLGGWFAKDYRYAGAQIDLRGRGSNGFSRVTEIDRTRNTTTVTTMSQAFPYTGAVLSRTRTHANGVVLSQENFTPARLDTGTGTVHTYAKSGTTTERDLDGTPLPTVTQAVDDGGIDAYGNLTSVTETVTEPGGAVWSSRTTAQYDNRVADWLLGLKTRQQVTKTAPAGAGGLVAPALTLTRCVAGPGAVAPNRDVTTCKLGNTGQTPASGIVYGGPANVTVTGPATCPAGTADCGTVTAQSGTAAGQYTGAITATPTLGTPGSANVSLLVRAPATLVLDTCSANSGTVTPTPATLSCRVRNAGEVAAQSISYGGVSGATIAGPTGRCDPGAVCGTVTVTTGTAAGNTTGTLTATPDAGIAGTATVNLWVYTPGQLALGNCSSTSPTVAPSAARLTCTVSNTGGTSVASIGYAGAPGTSVSGPTGACAAQSACGTVTVTTGTAAGTYTGTLSANPNTGGAAQTPINLTVLTPAQLTLANCAVNSPTTTPSAASMSCTVGNSGQAGVSSITYGAVAGASVSGPTGACAGGAACGTVTVTTGTAAGAYTGTLAATPNAGGGASLAVNLQVLTQPQLAFSNCAVTSPTTAPTAATMQCTVSNVGQTATGSISYGAPAGVSVAGPTGACGAGAACGTVTVTTGTAPSIYAGTLTATPAGGVTGSVAVNLRVYPPPPSVASSPVFPISFTGKGLPTYNVNVTANVTDGLAPFTYQWSSLSSNNTAAFITNPTSATASLSTRMTVACEWGSAVYRVVVTDALGRATSLDMTMNMRSTSPPSGQVCP
ncbi:FG-GAP-like repeat-containing protein [Mitsuaria sp. GD03876]|uniref:FG-GAP-like repeat-containing protein n=1 Tax=Mitsuaria sp. GD03876 TaxID=2975399 RepID=UPI00244915E0|nr:FG-GAP-like repeat-containing protein [Mitsuaria sp. GD03876]MDH0865433.1 hypothetical protein [Mitsuaria sp. GD03876]